MPMLSKVHTDTKKADGSASALALLLCQVFISAVTACAYPADTLAKKIGAVCVCVYVN